MTNVGIVGGGVSALHLGLKLLAEDSSATIYHPQTVDEIRAGRMLNSVVHQHDTIRREEALEVDVWNESNVRVGRGHDHCLNVPDQPPLRFWGSFRGHGKGVDYRMLLPELMERFSERGGDLVHATKTRHDLPDLQSRHELVAIGVGKTASGFVDLFDEIPEISRHRGPARALCCGFFDGVAPNDPFGVTLSLSPVAGELIVLPMETFDGPTFALLFENIPDGPAAHLAELDQAADPDAFRSAVLDVVRTFHPDTYERIDVDAFDLHRPEDLLQGSVRPVVRRAYATVGGAPVIAIGDLRVTMDPVTGAGANLASFGAWTLAAHIARHDGPFDVEFARRYEEAVLPRTIASVGFNDLVLAPPDYLVGLLVEMSQNQAMCDEFTEGFADPEHLWFDIVGDADTAEKFAAAHR